MAEYVLQLSDAEIQRYRLMAEVAAADERDLWAKAGIIRGASVADIGCGPGAVAAILADRVGSAGVVHAVDRDVNALSQARQSAALANVSNLFRHEGTAVDTGLAPGSVDVAMLRHVLAHNGGSEQAIVDHLATLVRPGGVVYLVDVDATALRISPPGVGVGAQQMSLSYQQFQKQLGNDMSVGIRLGQLLEGSGLERVEHFGRYQIYGAVPGTRLPAWAARQQMLAAELITAEDIRRWQAELDRLDHGDLRYTIFIPFFMAIGWKPSSVE